MTVIARFRRPATVAAVGALLALTPQFALAGYTTPKSAVQSVGTATMVAPSGLTGSWTCKTTGQGDDFTATVTGFTDSGPAGASYRYRITNDDGFVSSVYTSTSTSITIPVSQPKSGNSTTWTLTIWAVLNQWSSPVLSAAKNCGRTGGANGSYP